MQRSPPGILRTVGKINEDHKMYQAEKEKYKRRKTPIPAMQFKNVTNPPIICGNDTDKVIDLIAPPELHITIGVTNHLLDSLEEYYPLGKALVHSWIGKTKARVHR